jgi:hypothetical protein
MAASAKCSHGSLNRYGELRAVVAFVHVVVRMSTRAFDDLRSSRSRTRARFTICPDCGGRLRLLATITERAAIEKILRHLGLPADLPNPAPARAPPWLPGVPDHFDDGGSADREWPD